MLDDLTNAREAALAVHALCDEDRSKLLQSLSADERARLEALLSELQQLGIPRDFDVSALLSRLSTKPIEEAPAQTTSQAKEIAFLQTQSPARVIRVLLGQSGPTRQLLLQAHDWKWKREVLRHLPLLREASPSACGTSVPPRQQEEMLKAFCAACEADEQAAPTAPLAPRRFFEQWRSALRALGLQ